MTPMDKKRKILASDFCPWALFFVHGRPVFFHGHCVFVHGSHLIVVEKLPQTVQGAQNKSTNQALLTNRKKMY